MVTNRGRLYKKVIKGNYDYSGNVDQPEPPILYLITIYHLENSDLKVIINEIIHDQNTKEIIAVKESLYVIKNTWIFTNFCLKFLGLYNIYIENSFANKLTRWVQNRSFLKLFKILAIRVLSEYETLGCASCFILIKHSCSYIK